MDKVLTDHHASNESLPPSQANSDETCAVGPLTRVEGVLRDGQSAACTSQVQTKYSLPTSNY
jgi:hypothetical protein